MYWEIKGNGGLKRGRVDDVGDIVVGKKWRIFVGEGMKGRRGEKGGEGVL